MSDARRTELMELWDYITGMKTVSTDVSGLHAFNGIFGDQYVATRVPKFSANFNYPTDSRTTLTELLNGGTISLDVNLLTAETGIDPDGSVVLQSKDNLRYTAGRDAEAMFTAIYTEGVVLSAQRTGLFDDEDGFYIGYEGVEFGVSIRKGGSNIFIEQSNFNKNKLDGSACNKFILDQTKMNIYRITYGYLGIAPVIYQVWGGIDNGWITFHVHDVSNTQVVTHINKPYLPVRVKVFNNGNTSNIKIQSGSIYAGVIDGGGAVDASSREFSKKASAAAASSGTDLLVIHFHNKDTFAGTANKIDDLLLKIGIGVESNKPVVFNLYKIPVAPTGAVWTDVNTSSSNMETSLVGTFSLVGAELLDAWPLGRTGDINVDTSRLNYLLLPGEYAVFTYSGAGAVDYEFVNRWSELF